MKRKLKKDLKEFLEVIIRDTGQVITEYHWREASGLLLELTEPTKTSKKCSCGKTKSSHWVKKNGEVMGTRYICYPCRRKKRMARLKELHKLHCTCEGKGNIRTHNIIMK